MPWVLDLDGVVWLADLPIAGSAAAVAALRGRGERVLFATNNSSLTVGAYIDKLGRCGIDATPDDLCTSAQAAAMLIEPGETVLVCAGPGVDEAVTARGAHCVREAGGGPVDAVVVGWHRDFDYGRLDAAFQAIRLGARFIATNDDATYPTPQGPVPGGGALAAAVATAAGVAPVVAGKPYPPTASLVLGRLGDRSLPITFVGDRAETDGRMARALGARFVLVLSGVTATRDLPVDPAPDALADDLWHAVGQELAASRPEPWPAAVGTEAAEPPAG